MGKKIGIIECRFFVALFVLLAKTGFTQITPNYFKNLGTENGLSNRKVNCILEDKRGFLWFGTEDGLNRYDGKNFTVYKSELNIRTGISGNIITDLYEDKTGVMWISTADGGITKYDYRLPFSKQFKQFKHNNHDPKSIPENRITKITGDNKGYLWLGTSGSYVVRFNMKTERFDTPVRHGTKSILALAFDQSDILWVGREGGGLLKINTFNLTHHADKRYSDLYSNLPHATITSLFKDRDKSIWYGSWDNMVYKYSTKTNKETVFNPALYKNAPADEIVSFAEDKNNRIWMAGKKTGITIFNPATKTFHNLRHNPLKEGSLAGDHVNTVYVDRLGITWIGTNNGISVYNPLFSPFVQYFLPKTSSDIVIYDFYIDDDRKLWVGTSEGIYTKHSDSTSFEYKKIIYKGEKLAVTKFFRDEDKSFYIGTNYTLFKYDLKDNKISVLPNTDEDPVMKKLISSRIVSIARDTLNSHPVLIVSPYGHFLTYYDLQDKRWVSRSDSVNKILTKYNIKDNLVRKIYPDKEGALWLATLKFGLGNWQQSKTAKIKYYTNDLRNEHSLSSNMVYDMIEDKKGNFWISTYGGGINYFDRKKGQFTHIKESSNLSEGLQADNRENLWMLSNGHIHKYEPQIHTYSCYDLPNLQSTGGLNGYIYKDSHGMLYAAGTNYFITFNPDQVAAINHEPEIYFTDFKIFDKSFSHFLEQKFIKLDYSQNFFSFEFSSPEFSGDNLNYAYMLEGVDRDWVEAGKRNYAQYSNVSGGDYRFKVRVSNWKGSQTSKYISLNIRIIPPFWYRLWFHLSMFLLISALAYIFYRYRVNNLLKQQHIRNGIAQDLHDQIGSTLSSITVYSEVAKIHQEKGDSVQLKGILDIISETSSEMVGEIGDIVWAINPKNDHFESIFHRIQSYARPICKASGINFIFKSDLQIEESNIDMRKRKNLFLIIKEVINNSIKHANCKNIKVSMYLSGDNAELLISDDGVGFDPELLNNTNFHSLSGNGLSNIRFRAEELKAHLVIDSKKGSGSSFKLIFSLN